MSLFDPRVPGKFNAGDDRAPELDPLAGGLGPDGSVASQPVMDEEQLKSILASEINLALGADGGKLSSERRHALERYEGMPYGNEIEGRSSVVARSVLEAVEWVLPALLRVFTASEKVFEFVPYRPEETAAAEQATEYINYILYQDNNGFMVLHDWMKTALVQKMGYVQVAYVQERVFTTNTYTGLNDLEYSALTSSADVEVIEHYAYPNPDPDATWYTEDSANPSIKALAPQLAQHAQEAIAGQQQARLGPAISSTAQAVMDAAENAPGGQFEEPPGGYLHDCRLRVWQTEGRVRIEHVVPEEILISRRAPTTALDGKHFLCRKALKRVTDLREMGFDEDLIESAMGFDEQEFNSERVARFFPDDDWPMTGDRTDPAMRELWLEESYIAVDFDGDGIAELRKIVSAGSGQVIFSNEPIDDVPIVALCPIPMPGKHVGMSLADLVMDLQLIKTTLLRQSLDNLYLSNTPMMIVEESAATDETFDDLLSPRPGGIVRVANKDGIVPLEVPFVAQAVQPMLEYIDSTQEVRTGVSRRNQGLAPDDLNRTATGINLIQQAAAQRVELFARIFAETGIKELAKKILGLVIRHQQEERIIRLTGKFVPMDPRDWRENMDVSVNVGLGTGNKDQTIGHLSQVLQAQNQIIQMQKGLNGPLVTAGNVYDALQQWNMAMGFKVPFFTNPADIPPGQQPPQPPNPDMARVQGELAVQNAKVQADMALERQRQQFDMQQDAAKAQQDMQLERQRSADKSALEQDRERSKQNLELAKLAMQGQQRQVQPAGPGGTAGARRAPDGRDYIPDPNRPGKYMMIV